MAWTTALAIYFILWWVVLVAVLPFGVRNPAEEGVDVEPGHDPGAPTVVALKTKLIWTTIVATVIYFVPIAMMLAELPWESVQTSRCGCCGCCTPLPSVCSTVCSWTSSHS